MKCIVCGKSWPSDLINPFYSNEGLEGFMDPICALRRMREVHGDPNLEFSGKINQKNYYRALKILHQRERQEDKRRSE